MIELIKLPYRHYGTSTSVDLIMNVGSSEAYMGGHYGRIIQLHPFISGQICKYKLIENYGDKIYERIFLMSKDIQPDDIWWRGDEHLVYPVQCKTITGDNCVMGRSFKYTQGIIHYLQDYQDAGEIHTPVFTDVSTEPLASMIIPSPEEQAISYNTWGLHNFYGPCDPWLKNDVNIVELYPHITYADESSSGLISLANTDEIMQGAICIDNDPLEGNWLLWNLISMLNEIVISDVTITATNGIRTTFISGCNINVVISSRYNLLYQADMQYEMLLTQLSKLTYHMIQSRFNNIDWKKIEIRKLWSEEVFIDVYESVNPDVISQVLYFDLPIFSLGTLGLRSRKMTGQV